MSDQNGPFFHPDRATHCRRGHELNAENSHWTWDGKRQCLVCRQERGHKVHKHRRFKNTLLEPRR